MLSAFGELAATPVYECEGIFGGSADGVADGLVAVSNAPHAQHERNVPPTHYRK